MALLVLGALCAPAAQAAESGAERQVGTCRSAARMLDMARQFAGVLDDYRGPVLEKTFMAQMIPHHTGAIRMAELELSRGTNAEVKGLARKIISAQREEIATMTAWLREWYGVTPEQAASSAPPRAQQLMRMMREHTDMTVAELATVPAGKKFDKVFLQAMTPHHGSAAIIASVVPERATHPELAELAEMAEMAVSSQVEEIRTMTRWLQRWYGAPPCERKHR